MAALDQRLQDQLEELEAGASLDFITARLTAEDAELRQLLTLAATLREIPHPELTTATAQKQRGTIMGGGDSAPWWRSIFFSRRLTAPGLAAAVVVSFIALAAILGGVYYRVQAPSEGVVLSGLTGLVEVASTGVPGSWFSVSPGESLQAGDRIRTGDSGNVRLTFYDGSYTSLGPQSELVLDKILTGRNGRQITLTLERGVTRHVVKVDLRKNAEFVVRTPDAAVFVEGTRFDARVDQGGISRFTVEEGQIRVEGADRFVTLGAGQVTSVSPGRPPSPPAYQFSGHGEIIQIDGTTWTVGGLPVTVIDQTTLVGDPGEGDFVTLLGHVLTGDVWIADWVAVSTEELAYFQFAGPVESIGSVSWTIAGVIVHLDTGTVIDESLTPGSFAQVTFIVFSDGHPVALAIERLERGDAGGEMELEFVPDHLVGEGCQLDYRFKMDLANRGEEPVTYIRLIYVAVQGESFIVSVRLDPLEIEGLSGGEAVSVNTGVVLSTDWLTHPPGTAVKIWIIAATESGSEQLRLTRASLIIPAQCAVPTPTPTPTLTPTPTPSPTPEPSPLPGNGKVLVCHIPPGNPENAHTISISSSAVPAHLTHGDILGACP